MEIIAIFFPRNQTRGTYQKIRYHTDLKGTLKGFSNGRS